ncbi:hypothetical protein [Accumulibacter sp.]|uniref:hypothetical protein n=1 Tax=Accumulibacter sp. TaxID=2053492 RepID=UPI0025D25B2D|nr:hypothetical protein [Accumulibacter sp.]MCM8611422.1 hypothetical protein [Accumulibacter sp.]MCM8634931.1 hypothetical protein [Accumulibacter sp.]MCM8638550.1 hypothetical protein [Accumulibacter sp.]
MTLSRRLLRMLLVVLGIGFTPGFAAIFGYAAATDLIDTIAAHELVSPEDRAVVGETIGRCPAVAGERRRVPWRLTRR